jgi:hypothetical protein
VVIAATDSPDAVARTLASLRDEALPRRVELVVATSDDRMPASPTPPPPGVLWIAAPTGTSVPRLRKLGLAAAGAPIVAFTEDSCLLEPGWSTALLDAFDDPSLIAATGPVEPAIGNSPIDWAVFFCEYAPFLRSKQVPAQRDRLPRLAGNNFAVRRDAPAALEAAEIHETEVRDELVRTGGAIRAIEGALAWHVRRYSLREAAGDRLRFGIEYGRLRAAKHSRFLKAAALLAGPLIFSVQLARLTGIVLGRRRYAGRFIMSLPVTLALLLAWSVGESLGWTLGPARSAGNGHGTSARWPGRPARPSRSGCRSRRGTA